MNCIDAISRTERLSISEAKEKVKGMIIETETEYMKRKERFATQHPEDWKRLERWIEGGQQNYAAVAAPRDYINSLPSKGIRSMLIDAFNLWFCVPQGPFKTIESLVQLLHNASLILDDIEDSSKLRRRQPAAHLVYGTPQATNSATFMFIQAIQEAR